MVIDEKKVKKVLFVSIPIIIILAIFVYILGFFEEKEPEVIVYPASKLSDSLFDSQNTSYVESSIFDNTHYYANMPYSVDTISADGAVVGTGCIYPYGKVAFSDESEGMVYYYYSEIPKTEKMSTYIVEQLSQALNFGVSPTECTIEICASDEGYINGYEAEYQIYHLFVPGGEEYQDLYVLAYRLAINDEDELADDYDAIVAVATTTLSNAALDGCISLLNADILTVRYDKTYAETMIKKVNRDGNAEESVPSNEEISVPGTTNGDQEVENAIETEIEPETEEPLAEEPNDNEVDEENEEPQQDETTMGILLDQDFSNLTIVISWTESAENPTITIETPTANRTYYADETEEGKAYFKVGEIKKGVYVVRIKDGQNCGTFTSELIEN